MKQANKTLTWLVAGVVSLVLVANADAQSAKQRTGKVVRIKGAARYSTGKNVWQPLKVGAILKSGYVVQTAQDSYADVVLNEESDAPAVPVAATAKRSTPPASSKSPSPASAATRSVEQDVVRVLEDSVLSFDRLTAVDTGADRVTETELDLRTGAIFCAVKKQAAASRFEIKIPNGVAGIRGTYVYANSKGTFACYSGSVVAAYSSTSAATPSADAQVVGGGYQFDCVTRQLSPIAASLMAQLELLVNDFGGIFPKTGARLPSTRSFDQTLYFVSPN
jgi:FecR protein